MRWTIHVLWMLVLAGCAGPAAPTDATAPGPPSTQPTGTDPVADAAPWGRFAISLRLATQDEVAPATVSVELAIEPQNGIGQPVAADVAWTLEGPGLTREGQGLAHHETVQLGRGEHRFRATATAPEFAAGTAQATLVVHPVPLAAAVAAPANATKGEWVEIVAQPRHGYSDEGVSCTWTAGQEAQVQDAGACTTQARWLEEGQRTLNVTVDDGRQQVSASHDMDVLPITPPPVPSAVPETVHVADPTGPSQDEPYPPQHDITAAWFESDVDALYVGLGLQGAPEPASYPDVYRVSFAPSWDATFGDGKAERLRVTTAWSPLDGTNVAAPSGVWITALEAYDGSEWSTVQTLESASPDADSGIVWWTVPRAAMQTPWEGASIDGVMAEAGPGGSPVGWDEAVGDGQYLLA